jgi:hypothetical protein
MGKDVPLAANRSSEGFENAVTGKWKLNVAKSRFELSAALRSATSEFERSSDGWKASQELIGFGNGQVHRIEVPFLKFDGKDYPLAGQPNATWALIRIDDRTYDLIAKVDGNIILISHNVVSPDNRTRVSTSTVTDTEGKTFANITVWERL